MTAIHPAMQSPRRVRTRDVRGELEEHPRRDPSFRDPRPACARCSRAMHYAGHKLDVQERMVVERFLVVLDVPSGEYRIVAHCHGASALITIANVDDPPNDHDVQRSIAFAEGW